MRYPRHLSSELLASLSDTPVTMLVGARQTGKSTLAQALEGPDGRPDYLSFDDLGTLAGAQADPAGFLAGLSGPVPRGPVRPGGA